MDNCNYPQTFAAINLDEDIRRESRSGGVFTAFSDWILQENGVVYGVCLVDMIRAEHKRAIDENARNSMRGSKYIQSSTKNTFTEVKEDILAGKKVLYTGTSCQIAGLKRFLVNSNVLTDNLYCIDILCHGVPSPLIWKEYVKNLEKKLFASCISADFRDKKTFGWTAHYETLIFGTDRMKFKIKYHSDIFKNLFYDHYILRPSCYKCPYKSTEHPGDITIADYWGIQKAAPDYYDDKGVSLVLVNNDKGMSLFEKTKHKLKYKSTQIENSMQPALIAPFDEPVNRENFWKDYQILPFSRLLVRYSRYKDPVRRIIHKLRIIKKSIRS